MLEQNILQRMYPCTTVLKYGEFVTVILVISGVFQNQILRYYSLQP